MCRNSKPRQGEKFETGVFSQQYLQKKLMGHFDFMDLGKRASFFGVFMYMCLCVCMCVCSDMLRHTYFLENLPPLDNLKGLVVLKIVCNKATKFQTNEKCFFHH